MTVEKNISQQLAAAVGDACKENGAKHVTPENTASLAKAIETIMHKDLAAYYLPLLEELRCALQGSPHHHELCNAEITRLKEPTC